MSFFKLRCARRSLLSFFPRPRPHKITSGHIIIKKRNSIILKNEIAKKPTNTSLRSDEKTNNLYSEHWMK